MTTKTKPKKKTTTPRVPRARKTVKAKTDETIAYLAAEQKAMEETMKGGSMIAAIGRRKTSIARVRLIKNGKGLVTVNSRPLKSLFPIPELEELVMSPLKISGMESAVDVSALVQGGGLRGQAEAIRLGIARALTELNPVLRKTLKKLGYLTRDPRAKERKKFGLKRARRAPQWSKR